MSWVEIIKVQTVDSRIAEACLNYLKDLEQEITMKYDVTFKLYSHAAFSEQHMVWLEWNSAHPAIPLSKVSEVLVHKLKQFGLVNHSTWVDAVNDQLSM